MSRVLLSGLVVTSSAAAWSSQKAPLLAAALALLQLGWACFAATLLACARASGNVEVSSSFLGRPFCLRTASLVGLGFGHRLLSGWACFAGVLLAYGRTLSAT